MVLDLKWLKHAVCVELKDPDYHYKYPNIYKQTNTTGLQYVNLYTVSIHFSIYSVQGVVCV